MFLRRHARLENDEQVLHEEKERQASEEKHFWTRLAVEVHSTQKNQKVHGHMQFMDLDASAYQDSNHA